MPSGDNNDVKDRRRTIYLTEEQIDQIAERAEELAWKKFEQKVGQSVLRVAMYLIGTGLVALSAWLGWKAP